MSEEAKMTFLEHLEELRRRLIVCVVSVFAGMIVCWFFREHILAFLLDPLYSAWSQVDGLEEPKPLNFSSMLEPFIAYLKLSAIGGLFLAAPMVLYQIWRFVSPGLYAKEKRFALPFVLVSTVLFVGGSIMAYTMVFPLGFKFFLEFAAGQDMTTAKTTVVVEGEPAPPIAVAAAPETKAVDAPMDAGVDASIGEDESPPRPVSPMVKSNPPDPVSEKTHGSTWHEALLSLFAASDCAELEAAPGATPGTTSLTMAWQETRCGPPELDRLVIRRDEEKIRVSWKATASAITGVSTLVAEDPAAPGPHSYSLSFPTNPKAHRLAPVLMVKDYLSFAIRLLLAFAIVFELPIFISFLAIAGIVNYRQLIRFFRYFLVLSFIIGAILTPPDVITQILLALPLILLYGLSILIAYLFGERPDESDA